MNPADPDLRKEVVPTKPHWACELIGVPLALLGGVLTMFVGLFLGLSVLSRISGVKPTGGWIGILILWSILGAGPLLTGLSLLKVPSSSRRFWKLVLLSMAALFILLATDAEFGPNNYQALFRRDARPAQDASQLPQTLVTP